MELPGLNPLGSMAVFSVEAPVRKQQQVKRVTAFDQAQGPRTGQRDHPQQDFTAAEERDIAALRREVKRRGLPAGPPPSFQISLLEAEGGLEQALARIETTRSQQRDAAALRPVEPEPGCGAPADEASEANAGAPAPPAHDAPPAAELARADTRA